MKIIFILATLISASFSIGLDVSLDWDLSDGSLDLDFLHGHKPCTGLLGLLGSCPDARPCDPKKCKLPKCFCSGTAIPGNIESTKVPQMIVLTFQNGIRSEDLPRYEYLYTESTVNYTGPRRNPNGCPATGTFFVAHESTDYYSVQKLASQRHEIGVNSITLRTPADWWKNAKASDWRNEMEGQKDILNLLADVSDDRISGSRAPYLQMGGDNQMKGLKLSKLQYDASRKSLNSSQSPNLLWPYTYDYDSTQDCVNAPCPESSFKGLWQVPILALKGRDNEACFMLNDCNANSVSDGFQVLLGAFRDHYYSNRAPLVINIGPGLEQNKLNATRILFDYVRGFSDVYVVSASSMLQWIKNPTPKESLSTFKPWQCTDQPPSVCAASEARQCLYNNQRRPTSDQTQAQYKTSTCRPQCPACYPWIDDTKGKKC